MSQMPEDGSSPYGDLPYAMAGIRRRTSPYDRQRQLAYSMMQGGMDTSPIAHPMQGVSRLAQALVGSLMAGRADSMEADADKKRQDEFARIATIADPNERIAALGKIDPETGARFAGQVAMQEIAAKRKADENQQAANVFGQGFGFGPQTAGGQGGAADAIAGIESGGRYDAVGPETGKGRALGKYQVMSFNVAPWTKEVLGQEMTPEEFLKNPDAQEKVFQGKFGQYVQKYGPGGAARAWFAGEGGMNNPNARDVLGTSVADYERKFLAAGGGQGALPGQMPVPQPPGGAPQMPRPTEVPKPEPDPQLVQQAYALLRTGRITPVQAQQMVMDDVNRRWQIAVSETSADRRQAASDAAAAQREQARIEAENRRAEAQAARVGPEAMIRGTADNYIKNVRPKAENAVSDIAGIHQIRQLLDAGAFTGTGAEAKTYLAKLGEMVGLSPSETAANTQVLSAQLANRVLAGMGGSLGAGFSNADRDFVEKAKGGQIAMTETALRKLMDIGERQARMTLDAHGREVERFKKMPEMGRVTSGGLFDLPPAPSYQEWSKANPMQSAAPQQQGGQQQGPAPVQGARQAPDGNWYVPDPNRPGKYLMVR